MKKIETHLHTAPFSPCAIEYPRDIARILKKAGFDAVIITNHYRKDIYEYWQERGCDPVDKYLEAYHELVKYCKKVDIDAWLGIEVHLWRYNVGDVCGPMHEVLLYGIDEQFLRDNPHIYDLTVEQLKELCDKSGVLAIQSHPYRATSRPIDPAYVHGYEVHNGNREQNPPHINALAYEAAEQNGLIMTSGSDFHKRGDEVSGMYIPTIVKDIAGFVECLKDGSARLIQE